MPSPNEPPPPARRRFPCGWRRTCLIVLAVVVAVLGVARIAAPYYVKDAIDRRLAAIPGYTGRVDGVMLHLWRGAYRIDGMRIEKRDGHVTEPFFSAKRIDFSIAWNEVFHGRLVSRIYAKDAQLAFERGPDAASSQLTADKRWQDVVNDLFPIDITYLDIDGGVLKFVDTTHKPEVDISIHDLRVHASGLQNRPAPDGDPYPAKIDVTGVSIGGGDLHLFTKLQPLAEKPHFQLNIELKKVDLPALNDFLKAYTGVEVAGGRFEVFAQMEMGDGRYDGYVKPFFSDLNFSDVKDEDKSLGHKIWKSIVAGIANLVKNKNSKQVATRIPFSGETDTMDIHTWKTIENALHHGFVKALSQGFEGTPNPDHVAVPPPATPTAPAPSKS
jgi:hypothetical protein